MMNQDLHRVLRRQLRRAGIDPAIGPQDDDDWDEVLGLMNGLLHQADQDRYTLERSLDISSREMRGLYDEVRQDKQRLVAMVGSLPQAVLDLDQDLRVVMANAKAVELLGAKVGDRLDDVVTLYAVTGRVEFDELLDGLVDGKCGCDDGAVVARGQRIEANWQLSPVMVEDQVVGAVLLITDLRVLKARDNALRDARIRAEVAVRAEQARGRFLANVSHELRTPLSSIIGYTELARELVRDPQVANDLDRVLGSSRYLLGLINDLLDISKVDAGRLDLEPELFSLRTLIDQISITVEPMLAEGENRFDVRVPNIVLFQDRTRLTQCLLNLLSNAAKFTDHGMVTVDARVDGEHVIIGVHDTGPGIEPEVLDKIFERFEQGAPDGKGTGLGLSLTRRLTDLMGGEIRVSSELGKGASFTIEIPLDRRAPGGVSDEGEGPLVLVIDDDPENQAMIGRLARNHGFRAVGVTTAEDAMEQARALRPDLVLLDLVFPGWRTGWDLLGELRELPDWQEVPVMVCSMSDLPAPPDLSYQGRLAKPVEASAVLSALREVLAPASEQGN